MEEARCFTRDNCGQRLGRYAENATQRVRGFGLKIGGPPDRHVNDERRTVIRSDYGVDGVEDSPHLQVVRKDFGANRPDMAVACQAHQGTKKHPPDSLSLNVVNHGYRCLSHVGLVLQAYESGHAEPLFVPEIQRLSRRYDRHMVFKVDLREVLDHGIGELRGSSKEALVARPRRKAGKGAPKPFVILRTNEAERDPAAVGQDMFLSKSCTGKHCASRNSSFLTMSTGL